MRAALLLLVIAGSCASQLGDLPDADKTFAAGAWHQAITRYDAAARRPELTPAERVHAWTNAGLACEKIHAPEAARLRYEHAIDPEIPTASEAALYYLAELIRDRDSARALNLYYRAAASAEKNLAREFPYRNATDRILQLSMSR